MAPRWKEALMIDLAMGRVQRGVDIAMGAIEDGDDLHTEDVTDAIGYALIEGGNSATRCEFDNVGGWEHIDRIAFYDAVYNVAADIVAEYDVKRGLI